MSFSYTAGRMGDGEAEETPLSSCKGRQSDGVGDAGVGAAAVLYADGVHPVGKVSQN